MSDAPLVPMFTVNSDPLPMDDEMFRTLGEAVVHWSRIEKGLEGDLETMRRYRSVRDLAEEVPHAFSKKLELWRKSVRRLYPTIQDYQNVADEWVKGVKQVSKVRNHLIHGTWTLNENEKGEFLVSNYRVRKGKWFHDTMWVGQEALDKLLKDVRTLSAGITGFTVSKMVHAHEGMLKANYPPSGDRQARPNPANPEKP